MGCHLARNRKTLEHLNKAARLPWNRYINDAILRKTTIKYRTTLHVKRRGHEATEQRKAKQFEYIFLDLLVLCKSTPHVVAKSEPTFNKMWTETHERTHMRGTLHAKRKNIEGKFGLQVCIWNTYLIITLFHFFFSFLSLDAVGAVPPTILSCTQKKSDDNRTKRAKQMPQIIQKSRDNNVRSILGKSRIRMGGKTKKIETQKWTACCILSVRSPSSSALAVVTTTSARRWTLLETSYSAVVKEDALCVCVQKW